MMAQSLQPTPRDHVATPNLLLNKPTTQLDYSKYVKKFSSSLECGSSYCKDLNYRSVCLESEMSFAQKLAYNCSNLAPSIKKLPNL